MITHDTPESSNIARLIYDDQNGVLQIEFHSGAKYEYLDISYDIWNMLISAPSVGKFFNSTIRGVYQERKV
jgi:hypothetical protein